MSEQAGAPTGVPPGRTSLDPLAVLTRRVGEAEREAQRVRRFGVVLMTVGALILGAAAALVFLGTPRGFAAFMPQVVQARRFVITDADGRSRGVWGIGDDGAAQILLADEQGRTRLRLRVFRDGSSGLSLVDAENQPRLVLGVLPNQNTTMVLADEAGKSRAVFGLTPAGAATLLFADRKGVTRAGLGVNPRGLGTFTLADQSAGDLPEQVDSVVRERAPDSLRTAPRKANR